MWYYNLTHFRVPEARKAVECNDCRLYANSELIWHATTFKLANLESQTDSRLNKSDPREH